MEIINRRQRMASLARKLRRENKTIGFVPTMGALHEGHISLIKNARQMADVVIVSIFVNPTQFNDKKDLDNYPRDLTGDCAVLTEFEVDYIFAPESSEIYGENFSTFVYVENLTETLEGASRPGHFRGVATIVTILFNTIRPDFAFFGQKDAQQVAVISYPRGCRIRRVRVRALDENGAPVPARSGSGKKPLIVSKKALQKSRHRSATR